ERNDLEKQSLPELCLALREEIRVPREQVQRLARRMLDKHITEHVESSCRRLEPLRCHDIPIRRHCHERETPTHSEIHASDAAIRSVHRCEKKQILRQGKFDHTVNRMRKSHAPGLLAADLCCLEEIDRLAQHFAKISTVDLVNDQYKRRVAC